MLIREIIELPSFKTFFNQSKKRGTRQQRGFTSQTRPHQNLLPKMHQIDPSLNKKVEDLRKDKEKVKENHKRVLNQKDFQYITQKYDIRNITKNSPRYLGKTKIKLYWDTNVNNWCLIKEGFFLDKNFKVYAFKEHNKIKNHDYVVLALFKDDLGIISATFIIEGNIISSKIVNKEIVFPIDDFDEQRLLKFLISLTKKFNLISYLRNTNQNNLKLIYKHEEKNTRFNESILTEPGNGGL